MAGDEFKVKLKTKYSLKTIDRLNNTKSGISK